VFETLAYAGNGQVAGQPNFLIQIFPLIVLFAIFYFFLIRPQTKRQKALEQLRNNLKVGDKVVTTGGIYGEVAYVGDNVVHLRVAKDVKLTVAKAAIAGLQSNTEQKTN